MISLTQATDQADTCFFVFKRRIFEISINSEVDE